MCAHTKLQTAQEAPNFLWTQKNHPLNFQFFTPWHTELFNFFFDVSSFITDHDIRFLWEIE